MKRISILFAILILPMSYLFSIDPNDPNLDPNSEDFNLAEIVNNLGDYDLTEFQEILTSEEAVGDGTPENPGFIEEVKQQLIEQEVDSAVIDIVDQTIVDVQTAPEGETVTFNEVLEANPEIKEEVEDALAEMIAETALNEVLGDPQQEEDIRSGMRTMKRAMSILNGFGRATAQSSVASSLYGHQGYKLFAVSMGLTGALAAPLNEVNTVMDIYNNYGDDQEILLEELDKAGIKTGVSLQGFVLNVGINTSFLVDGLYLGAVLGSTSIEVTNDEIKGQLLGIDVYTGQGPEVDTDFEMSMSTGTYGIRANYQLIDAFSIPLLFRWNGVNVGTGFIYNTFNIAGEGDISEMLTFEDPGTIIANFDIVSNTYTIPLEISTAIRLLSVVNISLGAGVDVQFGGSEFELGLTNNVADPIARKVIDKTLDKIFELEDMTFPLTNEGDVEFFNPRVQVGAGVGLGPVSIDLNLTAYPLAGVTFGINAVLRL